jgi:hypothetical protein
LASQRNNVQANDADIHNKLNALQNRAGVTQHCTANTLGDVTTCR